MTLSKNELMALWPALLCEAYYEQLERTYGLERARKSEVSHNRGWYYITVAQRYPDGSVGLGGRTANCYRKKDVVQMILNLAERPSYEDLSHC